MPKLTEADLFSLQRLNTPAVYNGWEAITRHDRTGGYFNMEETRDFMPQMGPMAGYAVTVRFEPKNPLHKEKKDSWEKYLSYIASVKGPKIVIVQDLDKPLVIGSFWGEVNAGFHSALGCLGTITDGAVRDLDEMTAVGFKAIARRLCVGHAYSTPVEWGIPVEVFGCVVKPGSLIHADKHGFLVIPEEDEENLLEASLFMDKNECSTVIPAARLFRGGSADSALERILSAQKKFTLSAEKHFRSPGNTP